MTRRLLTAFLLVVAGGIAVRGYVLLGDRWPAGSIVMNLQLGPSGPLLDGSVDFNASAEAALATWNTYINTPRFAAVRNSGTAIGPANGANNVLFSNSVYGMAFGSSTLAVTMWWDSGTTRTESDVIFNNAFPWDSYRGPLQPVPGGTLIDFRRVALHEFGHVLGLGHPDQSGQMVAAIMNATISDLDHLTPDDIGGAVALYGSAGVPTASSVSPSSGVGASQTFALQYGDTAGAADLSSLWVWFNATFASTTANSCLLSYSRSANTLFLMNDAGTQFLPGAAIGGGAVLQNSQCSVALGSSTAVASGTTLTLNLAMTFATRFSGAKNVFMYAANDGNSSGWQTRGTWTVPAALPTVVTADVVAPSTGTGLNETFGFQYTDTAGAGDLASAWVWFNASFAASSANSCLIFYNRTANTLSLMNDGGTQFLPPVPLGSVGALANSQCRITLGGSSTATASGPSLTLNLAMTFAAGFGGAKTIFMYAASGSGATSGWQTRGLWTVQAMAPPALCRDFNCDGAPDLIWQHQATGQLASWLMQGTTHVSTGVFSPSGVADLRWQVVGVADFDGDGQTDLLWRHAATGQLAVWLLQGTSLLSTRVPNPGSVDISWKIEGVADFDGDGRPDLLWRSTTTGQLVVWYMLGTNLRNAVVLNRALPDSTWAVAGLADFDGDARPDILWQNRASGAMAVWYVQGANVPSDATLSPGVVADVAWRIAGVADFNGDGRPDLMWQNMTTGYLGIWFMNGVTAQSFQTLPITVAPNVWRIAAVH